MSAAGRSEGIHDKEYEMTHDEETVNDEEPLGMSRLGTLVEVVGQDEAADVLDRIEQFEFDRARAVRTLGRSSYQ